MKLATLINPLSLIILFVLVRSADLAITYGVAKSYGRCIGYSIVAILALIVVIITLFGLHAG